MDIDEERSMIISDYIKDNKILIPADIFKTNNLNERKIIKEISRIVEKRQLTMKFKFKNSKESSSSLIMLEKIINTTEKDEKLNIIYDYICDYLDEDIRKNNYCEFKDGKCILSRSNLKNSEKNKVNGCCYNSSRGTCKYLIKGLCQNPNPSCKFFMCSYLVKRGIHYNINSVPYVKYFLNYFQRKILEYSYFQTKEEIINKLLYASKRRNFLPFLISLKK